MIAEELNGAGSVIHCGGQRSLTHIPIVNAGDRDPVVKAGLEQKRAGRAFVPRAESAGVDIDNHGSRMFRGRLPDIKHVTLVRSVGNVLDFRGAPWPSLLRLGEQRIRENSHKQDRSLN